MTITFKPMRHWTRWLPEEDAEILRLYGKMMVKDIGAVLGRSPDSVSARASQLELIPPSKPRPTRGRYVAVLKEECDAANVDLTEALSTRRFRRLARVRWRTWEKLRDANYSLPGIGMVAGGYDHTSILHGIRRERQLRAQEARAV